MKRFALLALLVSVPGCLTPRNRAEETVHSEALGKTEEDYIMVIALDMSGSFQSRIAGDGFEFATRVIDRYFRDRVGTQDKLIIAQLSGTDRPLLWEGTPLQLRQQFPTVEEFRKFLLAKGDPSGSRIYDGLHRALSYLLSDPRVSEGKAKTAVFVLSDMLDNGSDPKAEGYMNYDLSELGHHNGVFGAYYVDQNEVATWRHRLDAFKVKNVVMGEFVGQPPLPSFDDE